METMLLHVVSVLLGFVDFLFGILFFWLPKDPLTSQIDAWDMTYQVGSQGLRWLNWFVDVQFYAEVLGLFVAVFLAFAAWKVIMMIVNIVFKGVESVPVVE